MGEAVRHDDAAVGVDGSRVMADDGAARSIALLVLAVTLVALVAGLLLEGAHEANPGAPDESSSQRLAPARARVVDVGQPSARTGLAALPVPATQPIGRPRAHVGKRSASISSTPA